MAEEKKAEETGTVGAEKPDGKKNVILDIDELPVELRNVIMQKVMETRGRPIKMPWDSGPKPIFGAVEEYIDNPKGIDDMVGWLTFHRGATKVLANLLRVEATTDAQNGEEFELLYDELVKTVVHQAGEDIEKLKSFDIDNEFRKFIMAWAMVTVMAERLRAAVVARKKKFEEMKQKFDKAPSNTKSVVTDGCKCNITTIDLQNNELMKEFDKLVEDEKTKKGKTPSGADGMYR